MALRCPYPTILDLGSADDGLPPLPLAHQRGFCSDDCDPNNKGPRIGRAAGLERVAALASWQYEELVDDCHARAQGLPDNVGQQRAVLTGAAAARRRALGLLDTVVVEGTEWSVVSGLLPRELEVAGEPGLAALSTIRLDAAAAAVVAASRGEVDRVVASRPTASPPLPPWVATPRGFKLNSATRPDPPSFRTRAETIGRRKQAQDVATLGNSLERAQRWEEYSQLCVTHFGEGDERAVAAVTKAAHYMRVWKGQKVCASGGLDEQDLAALIFEHFAGGGGTSDTGQWSIGGDVTATTIPPMATDEPVMASVTDDTGSDGTAVPAVAAASARETERFSRRLQEFITATSAAVEATQQQKALQRTQRRWKAVAQAETAIDIDAGASVDVDAGTTTAAATQSNSASPVTPTPPGFGGAAYLSRSEYTNFLQCLGYDHCDSTRWRLECKAMGALETVGPNLEQFQLLYSMHGRDAWIDAVQIFGERCWDNISTRELAVADRPDAVDSRT